MNVVIFGASGLIGSGVLLECLESPDVSSVRVVGRSPTGLSHPKLTEIQHKDFLDFSAIEDQLGGLDACFWCLGTASAGMSEADYTRVTVDYTRAAVESLRRASPRIVFCFVSGASTDINSKQMWARVKGRAERLVLDANFLHAAAFRPAFIKNQSGVEVRGLLYKLVHLLMVPLFPILKLLAPRFVTSNRAVGRAMITVAKARDSAPILENHEINALAGGL